MGNAEERCGYAYSLKHSCSLGCCCRNKDLLAFINSPSCSYTFPSSGTPHCCHVCVALWEQYRVSMWVGLLRGPGWFRSDGRRKLLQEIPNCQTHNPQSTSPAQTEAQPTSLSFHQSDWTNAKTTSQYPAAWWGPIISGAYICMPNLWCCSTPTLADNQDFLWHPLQQTLTTQLN